MELGKGIGLDIASRITGIFVYVNEEPRQGWEIKATNWIEMANRVVGAVLEASPDYVSIEDTYMGINVETKRLLDNLAGHIIVECANNGIAVYRGKTAQIDKACGIPTGIKRARRKTRTTMFAEMNGFKLPQDVADALCAAHWGVGERRKDVWAESAE